jgi:hypothetical protein
VIAQEHHEGQGVFHAVAEHPAAQTESIKIKRAAVLTTPEGEGIAAAIR